MRIINLKNSIIILSFIIYIILFFLLYPHVKEKAGILSLLPIIVTGLFLGFKKAFLLPLIILPLNFTLFSFTDSNFINLIIKFPIGISLDFFIGIGMGYISDLYKKSKHQYLELIDKNSQLEKEVNERIKTEEELIILKEGLENSVEERTSSLRKINSKLSKALKEQITIEMKIRQSEEYYRLLFESIHDPILIFEPENEIILDVNKKACEIYGFSREEFIGMSIKKISLNPDRQKELNYILNNDEVIKFETYQFKKDGSLLIFDISATIIENKGKKVVLSINRDITQQKGEQEKINLLAHALESINDSVVIADNNGRITFVNKIFLKIFGYSSEKDILQKELGILFPAKEFQNYFQNISQNFSSSIKKECKGVTKKGKEFPINISVSPIKNNSNENISLVFVIEDITERKFIENELNNYKLHLEEIVNERTSQLTEANIQLNEEIEEREKVKQQLIEINVRLDIALQAAGNGFADLNFKNNKIYFSPIFIAQIGFSTTELEEFVNNWQDLVHPDDVNIVMDAFQDHLNNNTLSAEFIHRLLTKKGDWKWFSTKIKVVEKDNNNMPARLFVILEDITLRKKAEENLLNNLAKEKELTETRSKFISIVSHEFRTPLSTILSSLELIENYGHKWTAEKIKSYYEKIKKSIDYLTEMLNEVSTINKAEAGMLLFNPQRFELIKYLEELLDEIKNIYKIKPNISLSINEQFFHINYDQKLLRHIFHNLVENAVKYTPPEKSVFIECNVNSLELNLTITDEGIGIPQEDVKKIFEPFTRGNNTIDIKGTGLGLSIVKKFVDVCKGKISLESQLNKGTSVKVILPLDESILKINISFIEKSSMQFLVK